MQQQTILCAAFLSLAMAPHVGGEALADDSAEILKRDDWSLRISPYVWAASLEGTVAAADAVPPIKIDAGFDDILRNLDLAAMVFAELRYQRFGVYADIILTNISVDADTPREILFDHADVRNGLFIGTFGAAYRVLERKRGLLDVLLGARAWSVDTRLNLDDGLLDDREFESNENWVDPMIGLKGRFNLGHGFYWQSLAHIGGFGAASDLTWDVFGGFGYEFNDTVSAILGYRHLEVDYDHGAFSFDVELSGPVIGATLHF